MSFHIIIPSRYASTRLPAKALCDIKGKPMVQHVYERALKSQAKSVTVATDDERIAKVCESFGAPVCITSPNHLTGTDRIAEAVQLLNFEEDEIIVNVQGDQPFVSPENINQAAHNLNINEEANVATLCERIHEEADLFNSACVKVIMDHRGHALYFSRSLIPWVSKADLHEQIYYKHMGLYAYRAKTILAFVNWAPASIELSESLEQLRFLMQGEKIHVAAAVKIAAPEVNTPEDLEKIRGMA
jgi:3-deoxy-manno-octulosonate cytidylyltransferase (CMP-KDO synthetase)